MNLIESVKNYIARRSLQKEYQGIRRQKANVSLEQARNIGVLYAISDEETYKIIHSFLKSLKTESRSVIALGFLNDKKVPTYLHQGVYNSIITLNDVNWFGKPVNQYVRNFFREKFDIFLNISNEDHFPLLYISACVNARMKVGMFNDAHTAYFDLMIKTAEGISQKELIDTMLYYIEMINQQNHAS